MTDRPAPGQVARFEELVEVVLPGRPMGGFYVLPDGDVSDWVRRSHDYIRTLPPKRPKKA